MVSATLWIIYYIQIHTHQNYFVAFLCGLKCFPLWILFENRCYRHVLYPWQYRCKLTEFVLCFAFSLFRNVQYRIAKTRTRWFERWPFARWAAFVSIKSPNICASHCENVFATTIRMYGRQLPFVSPNCTTFHRPWWVAVSRTSRQESGRVTEAI